MDLHICAYSLRCRFGAIQPSASEHAGVSHCVEVEQIK